jgi:hypothetical protein
MVGEKNEVVFRVIKNANEKIVYEFLLCPYIRIEIYKMYGFNSSHKSFIS